jgi:hypothetical protein
MVMKMDMPGIRAVIIRFICKGPYTRNAGDKSYD